MSYVDIEYYYEKFHGESVDEADFPALCERAGEIIEEMTMYRLREEILPDMTRDVQERIKKAVCAQVEYMDANGGSDMDTGADLQSAGLGKFSFSKSAGEDGNTKQSIYSPRAMRILAPTGLLYRGGGHY